MILKGRGSRGGLSRLGRRTGAATGVLWKDGFGAMLGGAGSSPTRLLRRCRSIGRLSKRGAALLAEGAAWSC